MAVILAVRKGDLFGDPLYFFVVAKTSKLHSTLVCTTLKLSPTAVLHTCPTTAVQRKATRNHYELQNSPAYTLIKKTSKPHQCKNYKYSAFNTSVHLHTQISYLLLFTKPHTVEEKQKAASKQTF